MEAPVTSHYSANGTVVIFYTYIGDILFRMEFSYEGEKVATVQRSEELKEGFWYEIVFHKTNLPLEVVKDIVSSYYFLFYCKRS